MGRDSFYRCVKSMQGLFIGNRGLFAYIDVAQYIIYIVRYLVVRTYKFLNQYSLWNLNFQVSLF